MSAEGKHKREEFKQTQPAQPWARAAPTMESPHKPQNWARALRALPKKKVTVTLFSFSLNAELTFQITVH